MYQLPYRWFNQISDYKYDIYLYVMLSSKLLAQASNKNTKFTFTKAGQLYFVGWILLRRFVDLLRRCSLNYPVSY